MDKQKKCNCEGEHHGHLCMLRSNGLQEEINKVTSNPKFYCFTCGGEANCSENLCDPAKID